MMAFPRRCPRHRAGVGAGGPSRTGTPTWWSVLAGSFARASMCAVAFATVVSPGRGCDAPRVPRTPGVRRERPPALAVSLVCPAPPRHTVPPPPRPGARGARIGGEPRALSRPVSGLELQQTGVDGRVMPSDPPSSPRGPAVARGPLRSGARTHGRGRCRGAAWRSGRTALGRAARRRSTPAAAAPGDGTPPAPLAHAPHGSSATSPVPRPWYTVARCRRGFARLHDFARGRTRRRVPDLRVRLCGRRKPRR